MSQRDKKDARVTSSTSSPAAETVSSPPSCSASPLALGVFVGLIVLIATREFVFAGVAFGIAFIFALVLMALFALAFKPNAAEVHDLEEQNAERRRQSGH